MARQTGVKPKAERSAESSAALPALDDPLAEAPAEAAADGGSLYDQVLRDAEELRRKPYAAASTVQVLRQHAKGRMTVWERIDVLQDRGSTPTILYQNWGRNLD